MEFLYIYFLILIKLFLSKTIYFIFFKCIIYTIFFVFWLKITKIKKFILNIYNLFIFKFQKVVKSISTVLIIDSALFCNSKNLV